MTLSLLRLTRHSFVFSLFLCKETLKPCKETLRTYLSIAHRSGFVFVWSMDLLCPSKPKRLLTEARYYLIANIPAVAGRIPQSKRGKKNRFRYYTFTLLSARYVTCIKDAQGLRISTCEQKIDLWPARVPPVLAECLPRSGNPRKCSCTISFNWLLNNCSLFRWSADIMK